MTAAAIDSSADRAVGDALPPWWLFLILGIAWALWD